MNLPLIMKQHQRFILLIGILIYPGISYTYGQKYSLTGVWKITEVDSCTRVVYPGAKVNKYPMQNVNGTITFNSDGKGMIKSNTQILCKNSDFKWIQSGDSLILKINTHNFESVAYSKFTFQDENKVKLEKIFGCGRIGLAIWYDVDMEKKE